MKELKIQIWPVNNVKPYERNAKKHDDGQVAGIVASIQKFGWDQPIVVDSEGVIIKGHGRRLAAIKMGMDEVPVLVRDDLTPDQVKAARLADNRVALGGFDLDMMKVEMQTFNAKEQLDSIFTNKEIERMRPEIDLGEMNIDPLVLDVDAAVAEQEAEAHAAAAASAQRRVPLTKAFGFKDVEGSAEIYINRFMVRIEAETGLKGEAALVAFLKQLVS